MPYKDKEKRQACYNKYRQDNIEKLKAKDNKYYADNKERINARKRKYRQDNIDEMRAYGREYYALNREKRLDEQKIYHKNNKEQRKKYYENNKDAIGAYGKKYQKNNRKRLTAYKTNLYRTNPRHKLSRCISRSISYSLKTGKGGKKWLSLVDFTLSQFMKQFQRQFQPGMTWENHGKGSDKWEIDHIIPVKAFNFTGPDDEDFKRCWALSNLRPMWGPENRSKGAKLEKYFQPRLAFG